METAIVVPALFAMLCAAIDFARIYKAEAILSHAIYQGALHGACNNFHASAKEDWINSIKENTRECLNKSNCVRASDVLIQVTTDNDSSISYVVTVTGKYDFKTSIVSTFFSDPIQMIRSRSVRRFR